MVGLSWSQELGGFKGDLGRFPEDILLFGRSIITGVRIFYIWNIYCQLYYCVNLCDSLSGRLCIIHAQPSLRNDAKLAIAWTILMYFDGIVNILKILRWYFDSWTGSVKMVQCRSLMVVRHPYTTALFTAWMSLNLSQFFRKGCGGFCDMITVGVCMIFWW